LAMHISGPARLLWGKFSQGCRVVRTPKSPEPVNAQSVIAVTWRDLLTIC
jgi:hypothetical protein